MNKKYPKKQAVAEATECRDWGPSWARCCVTSDKPLHLSESHCSHLTNKRWGPSIQQARCKWGAGKKWHAGWPGRGPASPRCPWGRSPCRLWGRAGRLRDPPDSGHHPAGWRRTCLSSGRRPQSRPAAPAGRGGSLSVSLGLARGRSSLPERRGRWLGAQRSVKHRCYATRLRGARLGRGQGVNTIVRLRLSPRAGLLPWAVNADARPLAPMPSAP